MLCLYYLSCFLFNKIEEQEGEQILQGIGGRRRREVPQTMYIHVSKCKIDKIKEGKNKNQNKIKLLLSSSVVV
jgi:hypothetical protein